MDAGVRRHDARLRPPSLRSLPGAVESCTILTVITVLMAFVQGQPRIDALLRPLYFALLLAFFSRVGRRYEPIRGLPMRLVQSGFLVLALGFSAGAVIQALSLEAGSEFWTDLKGALERGPVFLLGTTLLSYGLMLWIPQVLESHRKLRRSFDRTRGALQVSEKARGRMEARLVEADRLSLLGQLAAGVAHDLRNPLAIIRGSADSLERRLRSADELHEHVDVIRRSVDRADRTIQALIGLGRPRARSREPVDLDSVLREVEALVRLRCARREITCGVDSTEEVLAVGDREQLIQAVLNLTLNAIHATPDRGAIRLATRVFALRGQRLACAIVEDRGHGIPPSVREKLFTPFFTTRRDGTGLGLLSCRRIAADHGGRLGLSSRPGGGARAVLMLPATASEPVGVAS
ncbi:MAG: hypothetical protein Fur0037_13390 [Planctomycetota bacterium]